MTTANSRLPSAGDELAAHHGHLRPDRASQVDGRQPAPDRDVSHRAFTSCPRAVRTSGEAGRRRSGSSTTPPDEQQPQQAERPLGAGDLGGDGEPGAPGRGPRAWAIAPCEDVAGRVDRDRHLTEAPGEAGELRFVGHGDEARAGHAGRDEGVEAQPDDEVVADERRPTAAAKLAGRVEHLDVGAQARRGASRRARGRARRRRPATAGGGSSAIAMNGVSAAARLAANEASPARWLRATVIVGSRPGNDSTPARSAASDQAGSAPIQNGAGAPAAASTAADSSSRRTSRSTWRTSQRAMRLGLATAQVVGADADHRHLRAARPGRRRRAPSCCAAGCSARRPVERVQRLEDRAAADHERRRPTSAARAVDRAPFGTARTRWRRAVSDGIAADDDQVVVGELLAERRAERLVAGVTLPEGADERDGRHRAPPRTGGRGARRRRGQRRPAASTRGPPPELVERARVGGQRRRGGAASGAGRHRAVERRSARRRSGRAPATAAPACRGRGRGRARPLDANGLGYGNTARSAAREPVGDVVVGHPAGEAGDVAVAGAQLGAEAAAAAPSAGARRRRRRPGRRRRSWRGRVEHELDALVRGEEAEAQHDEAVVETEGAAGLRRGRRASTSSMPCGITVAVGQDPPERLLVDDRRRRRPG